LRQPRLPLAGLDDVQKAFFGQIGTEPTVAPQTRDCPMRIGALLAAAGFSANRILRAIVWLANFQRKALFRGCRGFRFHTASAQIWRSRINRQMAGFTLLR
jgi:enamine deaminase RidA (YjgF/YER057c/UK114 family)